MANIFTDSFYEAGGSNVALSSHTATTGTSSNGGTWALAFGIESALVVASLDDLHPQGAGGVGGYYCSGVPSSADYQVTLDLTFLSASSEDKDLGIQVRQATGANTSYLLRRTGGGAGSWDYYRLVAGSGTLLGTLAQSLSNATTYAMLLSAEGTGATVTVTATIDGNHLSNSPYGDTDASRITSTNRPGLWANGVSGSQKNTGDNYSADDIAGGAFELTADSGTYTYTGTAASLERGLQLAADSGSYTYTGTAATLARGYSVTADAGAYTYTGTAAGLTSTRTIGADAGSYTYTGTDATLTYTPATGAYNLAADAGSYTYTGAAATLARSRVFGVDSGSYTYTGTAAALARGFNVGADAGAYTYTGTAATFDRIYSLAASPGSYTISGTSVILTIGGRTLTPSVIYSVEPRQQTFLVNPQRQVFHGRVR